jgi:succinate-semialdehyde dehydrogenase/glutarate-semialdehyde dehydrogenase
MSPSDLIATDRPMAGILPGRSLAETPEGLRRLVEKARAAQVAWADTPLRHRVRAIRRVRDYLVVHADRLAATINHDNGKTRVDALASEIIPAAMAASYYARRARSFLKPRRILPSNLFFANKWSQIRPVPWGVVGIISPWNYPFSIPFSEVVMGLLAGNAVVLKVASQTQLVGRALEECFRSAGLPDGVFSYVDMPGRLVGDAMFEAGINKLFFTGSVSVGKQLMAKAAETLTPVCLELGGNDAMLVCPDADLQRAAAGAAWAGFQNCGQSCGGVERIYVHEAVYQPFLDLLAEKVRALRIGVDVNHQVDLGAMTTRQQMEIVNQHVQDALERGARIYAQADPPEGVSGNFLPAMVLTDVDHTMLVMREETFGPVVGVMKVADMEQAVRLANHSHLGLTGSVWSKNRRQARRLAGRIQAGVVTINDHLMSHGLPETPWGGFKQSGLGRTHGRLGFAEMTQPQCIVDDVLPGLRRNLWWYPSGPQLYSGLRGLLDLLYGGELGRRASGLRRVLKLLPRMFRP